MNLKELLIQEVPEFFKERFADYDKKMEKFASEIITNDNDCVKISNIVGFEDKCVSNWCECNSWYDVFNNAERMSQNLELLNKYSSDYYHSPCKKDDMQYIAIGEKYFVNCGKHRTCIAKALSYFDGLEFIGGVATKIYRIDYEFINAYEKLIELSNKKFWRSRLEICSIGYDCKKNEDNGVRIEKHRIYIKVYVRGKFIKWYMEDINKFLSMDIIKKIIYIFI